MEKIKFFLYAALFVILLSLWNTWKLEHAPAANNQIIQHNQTVTLPNKAQSSLEKSVATVTDNSKEERSDSAIKVKKPIIVNTDLMTVYINPIGGNVSKVILKQYKKTLKGEDDVVLLNENPETFYSVKNGLIKQNLSVPVQQNNIYSAAKTSYQLADNQKTLDVVLTAKTQKGLSIKKIFTFTKDKYQINTRFKVENKTDTPWEGNYFMQITRTGTPPTHQSGVGVHSFYGFSIYNPDIKYKPYSISKLQKKPIHQVLKAGWLASVQHYFLSAWVPDQNETYQYYSRAKTNGRFEAGLISSDINLEPGQSTTMDSALYVGPKITNRLDQTAPYLSHTIDFGFLWFVAILIFKLLKFIEQFIGNWGWSIIIVTILIKLAFYHLSASSYKSMAAMRNLQPKMAQLKARYKDDKQGMSKAMMELYKKEKVNPLGGCLPILVQIPVFISLYWVILESIELRHAPWILWIHDLSAKDPYFILPILMGLTMFIQQKLSPQPPDQAQAKMMMFLPVVMTVMFMWFPAGLVLYWVVNNMLSVAQQYYITKKYEAGGFSKK